MNFKWFRRGIAGFASVLFLGCNQGEEENFEFVQSFEVSARQEGVVFRSAYPGTYRFTITGGAYSLGDGMWATALAVYVDRPVETETVSRPHPIHPDSSIGDHSEQTSRQVAEQTGLEEQTTISVNEYAIFIVPDDLGTFEDNSGSIRMMVERKM
jgi:hypothetical protein